MNINHARLIANKVVENVDLVAHLIAYFANRTDDALVDHLCTIAIDPEKAITHEIEDIDQQKLTNSIGERLDNTVDHILIPTTISIDNLLMIVNITGSCIRNGYFKNEEKAKEGNYWDANDKVSDSNPVYAKYKYDFDCTFRFTDDIWK